MDAVNWGEHVRSEVPWVPEPEFYNYIMKKYLILITKMRLVSRIIFVRLLIFFPSVSISGSWLYFLQILFKEFIIRSPGSEIAQMTLYIFFSSSKLKLNIFIWENSLSLLYRPVFKRPGEISQINMFDPKLLKKLILQEL